MAEVPGSWKDASVEGVQGKEARGWEVERRAMRNEIGER